jgi:hypothetical protein
MWIYKHLVLIYLVKQFKIVKDGGSRMYDKSSQFIQQDNLENWSTTFEHAWSRGLGIAIKVKVLNFVFDV